jgi:hypothetical protein
MNAAAKKLWCKDGGRDVKASKHPRTRAQRLFDAAHHQLTNTNTSADDRTGTSAAKPSSGTTLFLWQNLEDFVAGKHKATAANGQLVPQVVPSRHMCAGTIAGIVFDKTGEVLWAGREQRLATPTIIRGLIARDKGCSYASQTYPNAKLTALANRVCAHGAQTSNHPPQTKTRMTPRGSRRTDPKLVVQ